MTKHEIRRYDVEMTKDDYDNYGSAFDKYELASNREASSVTEYNTLEEAVGDYKSMTPSYIPNLGYGIKYDLCEVIVLASVEYDDNGEFKLEEWISYDYRDRTTEGEANGYEF